MPADTNAVPEREALVRFAKRVAHDINNFSTVVRAYSELLLDDLPESDPMRRDVAEIHEAADATVRYLQRVTHFARVGSMRRMPASVDDGISHAIAALAAEHSDRPVHVTLGGGRIHADANWWRDVVIELLRNAHDAAPAGRAIVIRSAVQEALVVVDVEDEGGGIPVELRSTITEPFVTSKQGVRGAGIGLAIVAAFVQTLGGSLQFDRIDGDGSTLWTRARLVLPADVAIDEHRR
jgi:signal transduction histidine kinase